MTKTTIFESIGWSKYAESKIEIIEDYSSANSFEGCDIFIDGKYVTGDICTQDAIRKAFGDEVGEWIIKHM